MASFISGSGVLVYFHNGKGDAMIPNLPRSGNYLVDMEDDRQDAEEKEIENEE
jgi:hypothetical protein